MRSLFVALLIPGLAFATKPPEPTPAPNAEASAQANAAAQAKAESSASADNGVSVSFQDRLQIPHAPAPTAPAVYASGPCNTGDSRAFTTPLGGVSKGKSSTDDNCNRREAARVLAPLNPALALKVMCSDPYVAAVAAPEDCTYVPAGTSVTQADLEQLREETAKKIGTAFKQSQSK